MNRRDLIIIGGGPAGTAAALAARSSGLDVVLVEPRQRLSRHLSLQALARDLAVRPLSRAPQERIAPGFQQAVRRAGEVASATVDQRDRLLARAGVDRLVGLARFSGQPGGVDVDVGQERHESLVARTVLLACGSWQSVVEPCRVEPGSTRDGADILDEGPPRTAIVIGAGGEGVGLVGLLACAATSVTLVEARPRVLPDADADISAAVRRALEASGARVLLGRHVRSVERLGDCVEVVTVPADGDVASSAGEERLRAEDVFLAGGRRPILRGLGLERLGAPLEVPLPRQVHATALPWLLLAGTVTGRSVSAEAARREGRAAIGAILGRPVGSPGTELEFAL